MMTYQYIFIDLDDTIFDFQKSEQKAFKKLTEHIGFPYSDDLFNQFKQYNQQLWHQIELGTLTKSELLATRFPNFFEQFGFSVVSDNMDDYFRDQLAEAGDLIDGAENFLNTLRQHQKTLLAASNGVYPTQIKRLNQTGIIDYFDYIFISEKLGFSGAVECATAPNFRKNRCFRRSRMRNCKHTLKNLEYVYTRRVQPIINCKELNKK